MPNLSLVTHANKNTQEKVRFFIDYYNFVNQEVGKFSDLQFENHLSLIEKCIYQIENNHKNPIPYLDNYISNPLMDFNGVLNKYEQKNALSKMTLDYLSMDNLKAKKKWLKTNKKIFLNSLKRIQKELDAFYFDESLNSLISFLKCKHKLRTHRKLLMLYTEIIVTEFKYNNFSKKGVREAISKIMSDNIHSFPFADTITKKEEKEAFIKKRDFNSQFLGLKNLYEQKPETSYYIFRIINITNDEGVEFKLEYGDVTLISAGHSDFGLIKTKAESDSIPFVKDFFSHYDNYILAYTEVSFKDNDSGAKKAISIII